MEFYVVAKVRKNAEAWIGSAIVASRVDKAIVPAGKSRAG